jgi:hypothetical protein
MLSPSARDTKRVATLVSPYQRLDHRSNTFSKDLTQSAIRLYLEAYGRDVDVDRLHANRLAQNHLMQRFCAEAGILFLDATPALSARVTTRENVYFPDESLLNEAGEALVAEALAAFLKARPPPQ